MVSANRKGTIGTSVRKQTESALTRAKHATSAELNRPLHTGQACHHPLYGMYKVQPFWNTCRMITAVNDRSQSTFYSRTSVARTPMTDGSFTMAVFESLWNSSNHSRKQIFKEIFLYYHEIVCCVYSLESHHQGDFNENTQRTIIV